MVDGINIVLMLSKASFSEAENGEAEFVANMAAGTVGELALLCKVGSAPKTLVDNS